MISQFLVRTLTNIYNVFLIKTYNQWYKNEQNDTKIKSTRNYMKNDKKIRALAIVYIKLIQI